MILSNDLYNSRIFFALLKESTLPYIMEKKIRTLFTFLFGFRLVRFYRYCIICNIILMYYCNIIIFGQ